MISKTQHAFSEQQASQGQQGFYGRLQQFLTTQYFSLIVPSKFVKESQEASQSSSLLDSDSYEYNSLAAKAVPHKATNAFAIGKLNLPQISLLPLQKESQLGSQHAYTSKSLKQKKIDVYLPVLSQITDNIFLSGLVPAQNYDLLKGSKITNILNLCGDIHQQCFPDIRTYILCLKDASWESVESVFYTCFCFINDSITKGENILIHCQQGVSRSSSVVIAYLMFANDLNYEQAYAHTRTKRPVISPNSGFIFQICNWWRTRHSCISAQIRCNRCVQRFQVRNIVDYEVAAAQDTAIRDLKGNCFIQCKSANTTEVQPQVYMLTVLSKDQKLFLLKKIDTLILQNKQYIFDPRFIYVVAGLLIGTVIVVGSEAEATYSRKVPRNQQFSAKGQMQIQRVNSLQLSTKLVRQRDNGSFSVLSNHSHKAHVLEQFQGSGTFLRREEPQAARKDELLLTSMCSPVDMEEFCRTHGFSEKLREMRERIQQLQIDPFAAEQLLLRLAEIAYCEELSTKVRVLAQREIEEGISGLVPKQAPSALQSQLLYLLCKLGALRTRYRLENDFLEADGVSEQLRQLEAQNPAGVDWRLCGAEIDYAELRGCRLFERQDALDRDAGLVGEKLR